MAEITAGNQMLQDVILLIGVKSVSFCCQFHYFRDLPGDGDSGGFLQPADHLRKPALLNRCQRHVPQLQKERLVLRLQRLVGVDVEAVIHSFCRAADMVFSFAHIVNHHAVGADQAVYQRLDGHGTKTHLGVGDHYPGLDNVPGHHSHLHPAVHDL